MTFLEKLDLLMEEQGINRHKLSQLSEVPYTTIAGFYSKGYENAKISTVRKLANALGCTLDYLIEDEPETAEQPTETGELSSEAVEVVNLLRSIPDRDLPLATALVKSVLLTVLQHSPVPEEKRSRVPAGLSR